MVEVGFTALIQTDGANDDKITRIMRRGGLTKTSKWTILRQVPKALEAGNNVAIFCRSIDVSLLDELVCLTAFSNRRSILAHKDPLPKHIADSLSWNQQLAFCCMYSIATPAELDLCLNEIGLGVKVVKPQITQSKAGFIKEVKENKQQLSLQGHVAGDPHGAESEPLTSFVDSIPSRRQRRASQSSAGRGLDQHGQESGANLLKCAPGDVKILVKLDDEGRFPPQKPIILFDLNGTLTSYTFRFSASRRRRQASTMKLKMWPRPGLHHLRRLQNYFKLGIFSPAKDFTVRTVLPELEEAAGDSARIFRNPELILHRGHTQTAPQDHIASGGNYWDTVKPLYPYFERLHQVLLVDHDESRSVPQERQNMILIPRWERQQTDLDSDNSDLEPTDLDSHLEQLVNAILRTLDGIEAQTDLRKYTSAISAALAPVQQGGVHTSRN